MPRTRIWWNLEVRPSFMRVFPKTELFLCILAFCSHVNTVSSSLMTTVRGNLLQSNSFEHSDYFCCNEYRSALAQVQVKHDIFTFSKK